MSEYRYGGLYVVETDKDHSWVGKALRQIDPRLFLERQLTFDGDVVWCVVVSDGDNPPITILEWRDDLGRPISEPTERLVERIARMERDGHKLHQRVLEANRRFQEERERKMRESVAEISADVAPRLSSTRSVLLPRGQYLRQSRDRQRSKGMNV